MTFPGLGTSDPKGLGVTNLGVTNLGVTGLGVTNLGETNGATVRHVDQRT